ncbi:MAG: GspE/PulE family protein [Gemmatimonadaceae bacterium]|nr:GspE/PulE family protein [Gemmatimonadaceae bacterium]
MAVKMRLGDRLVQSGLITPDQLDRALQKHATSGEKLGQTLVNLGYVHPDVMMQTLCEDAGIPYIPLADRMPAPGAVALISAPVARRYNAVPLQEDNGRLLVAMADPFDMKAVTALERAAGGPIKIAAAPKEDIAKRLRLAYAAPGERPLDSVAEASRSATAPGQGITAGRPMEPFDESATAAKLADDIIRRGTNLGATDIHIEPLEEVMKVRYRLDGLLQHGGTYPKAVQAPLTSRIKILAGLDIAETRLPQDGRVRIRSEGTHIDLRVSTFPTLYGEDIVLRILDRSRVALNLERLGMEPDDLALLRAAFLRPHGLIPVTGPTGSGKTTTLYSALIELNNHERCLITLEDPIEYELAQIRQSQINVRAGLTFASGLRSILRHDPDTILVGEMRDAETVQIALSAALTGHLVLTTLHTNTAAGAMPRLLDMGAEPFILTSSVLLVISQRLIRTLCNDCKTVIEVSSVVRERFGIGDVPLYGHRGCRLCRQTGYRGRIGIFELLPMTGDVVKAVYDRRPAEEIHQISGRPSLFDDGLRKVRAGVTALDELLRVTSI